MGVVLILAGAMVAGFLWFFLFPFIVLWTRFHWTRYYRMHKVEQQKQK